MTGCLNRFHAKRPVSNIRAFINPTSFSRVMNLPNFVNSSQPVYRGQANGFLNISNIKTAKRSSGVRFDLLKTMKMSLLASMQMRLRMDSLSPHARYTTHYRRSSSRTRLM